MRANLKAQQRERLVREADRLRLAEVKNTLARIDEVQAETKMQDALRKNREARVEQLDNQELNQLRAEHARIEGDLATAGYQGLNQATGQAKLRLRQAQLENLAEHIVNRRPDPLYRGVRGKYKVDITGRPREVMFDAKDGPDLAKEMRDLLQDVIDKSNDDKAVEEARKILVDKGIMRDMTYPYSRATIRRILDRGIIPIQARVQEMISDRRIAEERRKELEALNERMEAAARKIQAVFRGRSTPSQPSAPSQPPAPPTGATEELVMQPTPIPMPKASGRGSAPRGSDGRFRARTASEVLGQMAGSVRTTLGL